MLHYALELLYRGPAMTVRKIQLDDVPDADFVYASTSSPQRVALLPFRHNEDREIEYLLRSQLRPSWGLHKSLCAISTDMLPRQTPARDALDTLTELTERPFLLDDAYPLGMCYSDPSTDTRYHMFAVDLTHQPVKTTDDLRWVISACSSKDPLVSAMVLRLHTLHGIS